MAVSSGVIAAFTEDQAARLTGITRSQLRYWDRTGFFAPSMAWRDQGTAYGRLYSFRDLGSLRVLNDLRNRGKVPLPHLREVKKKLAHLGDDLWARTTLYVLNRKVVFWNPDEDAREEVLSGQATLDIPLRLVRDSLEEDVRKMRDRDESMVGRIDRHKSVVHNAPVIAGTRIPVKSIRTFAKAGYSTEEILREYPTLTARDIQAAIAFEEAS